jgi:hypothetical protein
MGPGLQYYNSEPMIRKATRFCAQAACEQSALPHSFVIARFLLEFSVTRTIYAESNKASGWFSAMASNFKAASLGVRRPASQA